MKKIILTDVDGTLTKKSMVLSHAGFLIKFGKMVDDGSYQAWKLDKKNERLIVAVAENYRSQIAGMRADQLELEKWFEYFYPKAKNWYSTLDRLKQEIANGSEVVLVSGSSDFLIELLANELGCSFYASKYFTDNMGRYTGKIKGMFSEPQKMDCIQWNIDLASYDKVEAWGDTSSDLGLFLNADYKVLVDPTKETLLNVIQKTTIDEIVHN